MPIKKSVPKKSAPKKSASKSASTKKSAKKPAATKKSAKKPAATKKSAKKPAATKKSAKKPAAAKKPAVVATAKSTAADIGAAYTLPQLLKQVKGGSLEEARALLDLPDIELVEWGRQVATPRISTDCARLYGQTLALVRRATARQRQALLGVSEELIGLAIRAAHQGDTLYRSRQQALTVEKARQETRRTEATTGRARGEARRNQLRAVLISLTGVSGKWAGRITAAYGTAKEPGDLAASLRALCALGAELLAGALPRAADRLVTSGLSAELLAEIRILADEIETSGEAGAAARELASVSQGEVDLWDGVNLALLEQIMDLVNAAHDLDPSIPRLAPLALLGYFRGGAKRSPAPTPPAPPAP